MKLVLFDCDGTIVDSAAIIHHCMAGAFAGFALPQPDLPAVKAIIGLSLDRAISTLDPDLDARAVDGLVTAYKERFLSMRQRPDFHEPVFAGMDTLIHAIGARDDILVGMVTGKSRRGVNAVLERQGLARYFVTIRTADDCPSKPHPAMVLECMAETAMVPQDTIVVGDTVYDVEMARAAGALALGVSWGYHEAPALTAAGADAILSAPEELHRWLEQQDEEYARYSERP